MRGIRVQTDTGKVAEGISSLTLDSLETKHPSGAKVHVDDNGVMKWPVMFLYPEHTETDFIVEFDETSRFVLFYSLGNESLICICIYFTVFHLITEGRHINEMNLEYLVSWKYSFGLYTLSSIATIYMLTALNTEQCSKSSVL